MPTKLLISCAEDETSSSTTAVSRASARETSYRQRNLTPGSEASTIFIVDDDQGIRETIRDLLVEYGFDVECFADGRDFLDGYKIERRGCLLTDALMPQMSGIELLEELNSRRIKLPVLMMSGNSALHMAVQAMKFGAVDFIEKPFKAKHLLAAINAALVQNETMLDAKDFRNEAALRVASLTTRQREILDLVVAGIPSKNIAADLNISQRTVDNHRAAIGRKTCSKSLSSLIQTALCAGCGGQVQRHPQLVGPVAEYNEIDAEKVLH